MSRFLVLSIVLLTASLSVLAQTPTPATPTCDEWKTRAERAETRLSDWPALARYANDNAKTGPPARN